MSTKKLPQKELDEKNEVDKQKDRLLVLHNDDYHTFDYVIDALIEICGHDLTQAEQCTFLIHFKGKCDVKKGTYSSLRPMKIALSQKDLKSTID